MAEGKIKISVETQEAIQNVSKLEDSFKDISKEAEDSQKKYTENVSKQAKASKKIIKNNSERLKSQKKITESLKEVGKESKEAFNEKEQVKFNKELDNTEKKSEGLTKRFSSLKAVVIGAFSVTAVVKLVGGIFNLNKEIQKVQSTAKFLFGKDSDFKSIGKEARNIASIFDKDVNEVLKTANVLSRQYGIEGTESLSLIQEGIEKGADLNGDFLEQISEYGTFFKQAGLEADEAISVITQQVKEGVFSDKGVDAIKEATLSLREFTPATKDALKAINIDTVKLQKDLTSGNKTYFQAMQEIVKKTKEFGVNSKEAGTILADVFKGAGEDANDFIFRLDDINTNLSEQESVLTEIEEQQNKTTTAWNNFTESVASGDSIISDAFVRLSKFAEFALKKITTLFKTTQGIINSSAQGSNDLTKGIIDKTIKNFERFNNLPDAELKIKLTEEGLSGSDRNNINKILEGRIQGLSKNAIKINRLSSAIANSEKGILERTKSLRDAEKELKDFANNESGFDKANRKFDGLFGIEEDKGETTKRFEELQANLRKAQDSYNTYNNVVLSAGKEREKSLSKLSIKELKQLRENASEQSKIFIENELARKEFAKANNPKPKKTDKDLKKTNDAREKAEAELQKKLQKLVQDSTNVKKQIELEGLSGEERILKEQEFALEEIQILEDTLLLKNAEIEKDSEKRVENQKKIITGISEFTTQIEIETQKKINDLRQENSEKELERKRNELGLQKDVISEEIALIEAKLDLNNEDTSAGDEIDLLRKKLILIDEEIQKQKELLTLRLTSGNLSEDEIKIINFKLQALDVQGQKQKNNINEAIAELGKTESIEQKFGNFLGDIFGTEDPEKIQAIKDAFGTLVSSIVDIYSQGLDNQIDNNQKLIDSYNENISELENKVEDEKKLQEDGNANNLDLVTQQLEDEKAQREIALAEQEELARKKRNLETIQQATSLVTASANIFSSLSALGPVGIALAIATIGTMFGAFASAKAQASQNTQFEKGDSIKTGSKKVRGKRHSDGGEMLLEHAEIEGGESVNILSRGATAKNFERMAQLTKYLNSGGDFKDYFSSPKLNLKRADNLLKESNVNNIFMQKTEDNAKEIRKTNKLLNVLIAETKGSQKLTNRK